MAGQPQDHSGQRDPHDDGADQDEAWVTRVVERVGSNPVDFREAGRQVAERGDR